MLLAESLHKPAMAVFGVDTGNVKSEWKCLFNCSHKYLVQMHSQTKEQSGLFAIPQRYSFLFKN